MLLSPIFQNSIRAANLTTPQPHRSPSPQEGEEPTEVVAPDSSIPAIPGPPQNPSLEMASRNRPQASRGASRPRIRPRYPLADDIDLHFHPQLVLRTSSIGSGERNCLARITRDRDADEIAVSDDAVGGIEFDPTGARQIDLAPCV